VLYFLGYLGWGAWPCLFLFLVPAWWALTTAAVRGRDAAGLGFTFGFAAYAGGHLWLLALIGPYLDGRYGTGAVLWIVYGVWFALAFAVYGALFHALRHRGVPLAVAGIAPYVLVEWLQPQIFPLYAGNGLVAVPLLAQTADVGGPLLLTALLAGANLVMFETLAWLDGRRPRPLAVWVSGAVVACVVLGYGRARMAAVDDASARAPAIRVGLVQANLDVSAKDALGVVTHRRHLEQTRELLNEGDVDLVVWPESAYVRGIRRPLPVSSRPIVQEMPVPLLFGASSTFEIDGRKVKANSVFLAGEDGMIRAVYDKNLLIPLAESLPFGDVLPLLARLFPHAEEFAAATVTSTLELGPWRIATPICYEAIRPEFVRRMMAAAPHLLITLANDAWFGDSQEPWLHLGLARLRAIEHRRWLVRATNSGVSAIVDPAGRVVTRTGLLTRENLHGTVHPLAGQTIYARVGDWPGWVALGAVGVALVRHRRR
jgi:apolipoprotein N-acyltransferase